MKQLRIPAVYMRGGTSKGVFFLADDLPSDPAARDRILMRVIGSPDRYGKHTDGMGGATSSTSKVVILSKSKRVGCDVDYLFGQVAIDKPLVDWSGNCGNLSAAVGPFAMQLKSSRSLFGALAEAIVYQQLSNKAAATIYGRIEALYPRAKLGFTPAHIQRTADDKLRGVGLSRAKVLALRDLAEKVATRRLPTLDEAHQLDDTALIERLIEVRGIGRWSAEMFLMFRLGRPDVLPVDDYSLCKAYATAFRKRKLPSPEALAKAGEKWRPFRTVASWYLWQTLNK